MSAADQTPNKVHSSPPPAGKNTGPRQPGTLIRSGTRREYERAMCPHTSKGLDAVAVSRPASIGGAGRVVPLGDATVTPTDERKDSDRSALRQ